MPHGFFEQIEYLETVIKQAVYFHVAFAVEGQPYVVPMNYGYANGVFYTHSKPTGRKLDLLAQNPKVAFSLQANVEPLHDAEKPENCTMRYLSVIGEGIAELVQDNAEKIIALNAISAQYDLPPCEADEKMLNAIAILKITPATMAGKWGNVDCDQYFETNQ
ncbi:MAG: pyridoxamine 5'-phosphate oxidase family protein [Anaerolineae bacterium]|jgi:nitroimidazol reductase NimA-like FMN-containing flavoprotein (pyridoxamine 5'-phosphate oxidase superfamily)|nr:pyridoxamine 5'-phosphate oxidase family protein [Anaerolineae bacterium]